MSQPKSVLPSPAPSPRRLRRAALVIQSISALLAGLALGYALGRLFGGAGDGV